MHKAHGVADASTLGATWVKSEESGQGNSCVEVAKLADGEIALRDSKRPTGPALIFTPDEFSAFISGSKNGEFDHFGQT